jgi:osmotically inducible protein OsmC
MAAIEREATCTWTGPLAQGDGRISAAGLADVGVSLPTRLGPPGDATSPEELLAAAHASCFAMALAAVLTHAEVPPGRLEVGCRVRMDEDPERGFGVTGSTIAVEADVDGLAREALEAAIVAADASCPYSALLRDAGAEVVVGLKRP